MDRKDHPLPESNPMYIVCNLTREKIYVDAVIQALDPVIKEEIDTVDDTKNNVAQVSHSEEWGKSWTQSSIDRVSGEQCCRMYAGQ